MGFDANPTTYLLDFGGTPYEGLEVRVRHGSVQIRNDFDNTKTWRDELEVFQRVLVGWNLESDGEPLPLTVESMVNAEDKLVSAMVRAWITAGRPAAPLGQPSTPGETESEPPQPAVTTDLEIEGSMPMASLAS